MNRTTQQRPVYFKTQIKDAGPCEVWVTIPGLTIAQIGWNHLGKSSKICDLFEAGWVLPTLQLRPPSFVLCDSRLHDYKLTPVTCDYDVQEDLHSSIVSIPRFDVWSSITSFSRDSYVLKQKLFSLHGQESNRKRIVYATAVSRFQLFQQEFDNIARLPSWLTEKLQDALCLNEDEHLPKAVDNCDWPSITSVPTLFHTCVLPSDYDRPFTASDSLLVRKCMDALVLCDNGGFLAGACRKSDSLKYVKQICGRYFVSNSRGNMKISVSYSTRGSHLVFYFTVYDVRDVHVASFSVEFFEGPSFVRKDNYSVWVGNGRSSDKTPWSCSTVVPLGYDGFNTKTGEVILWRLALLMQSYRMFLLKDILRMFITDLGKDLNISYFVVATNCTIKPEFHKLMRDELLSGIPVHNYLARVGQSSFDTGFKMLFNGNCILFGQTRVVVVDKKLRKPTEDIKNSVIKYSPVTEYDGELEDYQQPFDLAMSHKKFFVDVLPQDIDANKHSNQSSYLRHCTDAVSSQPGDSALARFTNMSVSHLSKYYAGESVLGDNLEVCFWEDPLSLDSVKFITYRKSKPIFYCTLRYTRKEELNSFSKL